MDLYTVQLSHSTGWLAGIVNEKKKNKSVDQRQAMRVNTKN